MESIEKRIEIHKTIAEDNKVRIMHIEDLFQNIELELWKTE
jgi:hypothetical protein